MATLARLNVILGLQSKSFSRGLDRAQFKLKKFGRTADRTGRQLTTSLTLPTIAAGAASVKMAVDYETSMTKIVTLVGISQKQVAEWGKDLLRLAPELGKAPRELAEGLFFVTSAGFRGAEALDVLTKSAEGSNLGLGETAVVADAATSAINAYGKENLSAADAVAILRGAVQKGKAEAESIAPTLGNIVPVAAEMGVAFHEVAASYAAMTLTGTDAATAATNLGAILSTLQKGSQKTRKGLIGVGTSLEEMRATLRGQGLIALLQQLKERFGDNEDAAAQVFGNVRALRGLFSIVGKNAAANIKIFEEMAKVTGEDLNDGLAVVAQSSGKQFADVLATIQAGAIAVGQAIIPVVLPAIQKFGEIVQQLATQFSNLSPTVQKMIVILAALAAAIGPVLIVLGLFATGLGTISVAFVGWGVAIAAAAAVIVKNWKVISGAFQAMYKAIKPALSELKALVLQVFGEIVEFARRVWPVIQEIAAKEIKKISVLWEKHGETILAVLRSAWNFAKNSILAALAVITGAVETFLHIMNNDWPSAWETVKTTATKVMDTIGRHVKAVVLRMRAAWLDFGISVDRSMLRIIAGVRKLIAAWLALPFVDPVQRKLAESGLTLIDASMGAIVAGATAAKLESQALTKEADKLLEPIKKADAGLVEMQSEWVSVGNAAEAAAEKTVISITRAGEEIRGKLKGGFGRGIEDGAEAAKVTYANLQDWIAANPIRPTIDTEHMQRQLAAAGLSPDTGGTLP